MATIQINKTAYDFHNAELTIVGATGVIGIVDGLESIGWKSKFDRQMMFGANRLAQDYTDGEATYEGSIGMQLYWWRYIIDFTNAAGIARATMEMTYSVNYYKPGFPMATDTFWRCRWKGQSPDFKRGADALIVPADVEMINVFQNGIDDFGNRLK
jgi:hypothetical protein